MKTPSGSNDSTNAKRPETASRPEENSVTFSLSALMAQGTQAPTPPVGTAAKDDSGLIDLNALTAMEDSAHKSPAAAASPLGGALPAHMGLFPFEAPSIAAAPPTAQPADLDMPQKPKRSWIWLGAAGVAVAAVAAFFIGMNGGSGDHAQGTPTSTVATAPVAPTAVAAAVLEAPKAADPGKVAAADPGALKDKTAPPPTASVKAPLPTGKAKSAKADPTEKKDGPPAITDKKPAGNPNDPCHGDLMCAMQHATGK